MDFLRSRRFRIALAWSPFVGIVLVTLTWWGINRYGRWQFERTMDKLAARGFPRTMKEQWGPGPLTKRIAAESRGSPGSSRNSLRRPGRKKRNGGWAEAMLVLDAKVREIQSTMIRRVPEATAGPVQPTSKDRLGGRRRSNC